jgi:Glycosyltransferase WbsX
MKAEAIQTPPSSAQAAGDVRLIAFYLPQFHPIPENDAWWGTGFTEWTNVAKAKPLFPGHYQPHIPADLGFYDLRLPETRRAQADLAKHHGVHAFCYYHYWFAGKRLLERPFTEVLASGEPDFPFCLCWANQTWTGIWHGCPERVLMEQTYPGLQDHQAHFDTLLPAFTDSRYVTVDGKPIFLIFQPTDIDARTTDLWRDMAMKAGLQGLHLVAVHHQANTWVPQEHGFDGSTTTNFPQRRRWISWNRPIKKLIQYCAGKSGGPTVYDYKDIVMNLLHSKAPHQDHYPILIPNWDNTPRSGRNGLVLHNSTPELFRKQMRRAFDLMKDVPSDRKIVFVKSWNEWAEGNYLEPDQRYGMGYLEVIRDEVRFRTVACVKAGVELNHAPI